MGNEEREKCLAWLESKENCIFDFMKEMLNYCRSDVDILRQACLKFLGLLMSATGDFLTDERGKPQWKCAVDPFGDDCLGVHERVQNQVPGSGVDS